MRSTGSTQTPIKNFSLLSALQPKPDAIRGATLRAITAIGAILLARPRPHNANPPALVAIIALLRSVKTERRKLARNLQRRAKRTNKPAPAHQHHQPQRQPAQGDKQTQIPHGESMLPRKPCRGPKFSHTNRHVHARLPQNKPGCQPRRQHQIPGPAKVRHAVRVGPKTERIERKCPVHKLARAQPAAKSLAKQGRHSKPHAPESPEHARRLTGTGDDRAVLAAHKGHNKGATEHAKQGPLAQKQRGGKQYRAVTPLKCPQPQAGTGDNFMQHPLPPAFPQVPCPWTKWQG
ncbi:hypothetical protein SDC9_05519 [bioreactor metagenome]|uniref:Uncharacterized protein n=1 Tax=bioreactor metagenome TaxID=1076179 RepID=A0A644SZA6_9ZZZZ